MDVPSEGRTGGRPLHAGDRLIGYLVSAVLALLTAYGLAATPGLMARWGASWLGWGILLLWLAAAWLAVPLAERSPSKPRLIELAALQVVLRVAAALLFAGRTPGGDALYYLILSGNVLAGRGLSVEEPYIGSTVHALYPPAYALLLSGWISCFGASAASLLLLNTLIDTAAAMLIWRIGDLLDRPGAGRAAAWLYLLWPSTLLSAPLAQKEGLCALLILILAHQWLSGLQRGWGTLRGGALIGLAAGLLALTQPGQAPLAALFGLSLVPVASLGRVAAIGFAALPFALLLLLPWWIRNWLMFGAFVPLTTTAPISLWIGNNPAATGNWMPPPAALRGMPELDYGRAIGGLAKQWIASHPLEFLRLTATKFVRAVGTGQFGVGRLAGMTPRPSAATLAALLPLAQLSHLLLLGNAAVAALRQALPVRILLLLVLACLLQLVLFGVWFEFGERHREFMTPLLLLTICCAFTAENTAFAFRGRRETNG